MQKTKETTGAHSHGQVFIIPPSGGPAVEHIGTGRSFSQAPLEAPMVMGGKGSHLPKACMPAHMPIH